MAREVCEIHVADTSAADPALQVVGRFVLDDGKLTYELEKGDSGTALMFKRILLEDIPVYVPDGGGGQTVEINSRKNPDLWFHALGQFLGGSYVRARYTTT